MESKENVAPESKKNRARGENWTQEEKVSYDMKLSTYYSFQEIGHLL